MKKIFTVIMAFLFGAFAIALIYTPHQSSGLMILVVIIGALLLYLTWPHRHATATTPPSTVPNNELNRIYILVLLGATILLVFEIFSRTATDSYFPLVMVITFVTGFALTALKQKYTVVEYLTLKARDEREQYLIDTTARRAYAFIRVLALMVAIALFTGLFQGFTFSPTNVGYLILAIVFIAQTFFMLALRKQSK